MSAGGFCLCIDQGQDDLPFFQKSLHRKSGVGRAGGGKLDRLDAGERKEVPLVHGMGQRTVAGDVGHAAALQDRCQVIGLYIPHRAVGGAGDGTGRDRVPQRDMVREREGFFLLDRHRRCFIKEAREQRPESVLRVAVEEFRFAGFDRRKGAQNQQAALPVVQRRDGMDEVVRSRHGLPSFRALSRCTP